MATAKSLNMEIALVAAVAENGAIGAKGTLPWKISSDMKLFKSLTMGHVVLMGRRTFESIGKALPGRDNVVISTTWKGDEADNIRVFESIEAAIEALKKEGRKKIMVIGGGKIYQQTMPHAQTLYITRVKTEISDADTFFSEIDKSIWKMVTKNNLPKGDKDEYFIEFQIFKKITA